MAFWHTMIGKKVVMAVTGIVLIGFVIAHMLGNIKIFSGPDEINAYSRFLREVGSPELAYGQLLWVVRIVLLICVDLRSAHDALGWGVTGCLHYFSSSSPDRRRGWIPGRAVQTSRRLPKRGRSLRHMAHCAVLRCGDGCTLPAPLPRDLEHVAN